MYVPPLSLSLSLSLPLSPSLSLSTADTNRDLAVFTVKPENDLRIYDRSGPVPKLIHTGHINGGVHLYPHRSNRADTIPPQI